MASFLLENREYLQQRVWTTLTDILEEAVVANSSNRRSGSSLSGLQLRKLTPEQVEQIDRFLEAIGDYGEVHVIVQRGEVRYINKVESHKVWNNEEGDSG